LSSLVLRPTDGPEDWRAFLAKPDLHWKAGYSAMETAFSWEAQKGLPPEIVRLFPNAELLLAVPEYKVALPGGTRDSQNDVFALLRDDDGIITCMVEAKRNEPFGPTLDEWLKDASQGKLTRLASICKLLGVQPDDLDGTLRYQLFHRAASALVTAKQFHTKRAALVVQSFSPEHCWYDDYQAFTALFGLSPDPDELKRTLLPEGTALFFGWASCAIQTESTLG